MRTNTSRDSKAKKSRTPAGSERPGSEPVFSGLAPPDGAQAAWQFRFLEEKDLAALEDSVRNWYGVPALTTILPAAVTDGQRLYGNWLGACFAIDLASGKTVWKTQPDVQSVVSQLRANNAGRMMLYSTNTGQFALCLGQEGRGLGQEGQGKGVVLSVSAAHNESNRFRLVAYDAPTGSVLWTSDRTAAGLAQASFIGTPLVDGNSVFAVSHQVSPETQQANPPQ